MTARLNPETAIQAATEILVAFLQNASISPAELPGLVRDIRAAVEADLGDPGEGGSRAPTTLDDAATGTRDKVKSSPAGEVRAPAVAVAESVQRDYLVSLEDGKHYRSLRRHLMSKYGMTPDDYRAKWSLPADYPMVAPSYAEARSLVAKRSGLGRMPPKKRRA